MTDLCPAALPYDSKWDQQPETAYESHLEFLRLKKLCDIAFTFENSSERVEAHQLFLRMRSPKFDAMLRGRSNEMREIKVEGVSPSRFQEFLEFLYADKFEVNIAGALDLLKLGNEYGVQPLVNKCEQVLKTEIKVEDAIEVFETASKYNSVDLMDRAAGVMASSLSELSQSVKCLDMKEDTVVNLLKRDDLTMEEVDLFRLAVKWGQHQVDQGRKYDLQEAMANVIPLVRFAIMKPSELAAEVLPTGLIPSEYLVNLFAFCASDQESRETIKSKLKSNCVPRKGGKLDELIQFYPSSNAASNANTVTSSQPFRECISVTVSTAAATLNGAKGHRKPVITGISVCWPSRNVTNSSLTDNTLNFRVGIRWTTDGSTDYSSFVANCVNCEANVVTEVSLYPPVELLDSVTYHITAEDESLHSTSPAYNSCYGNYNMVQYKYSQPEGRVSSALKSFVKVEVPGRTMELNGIERNTGLPTFANSKPGNVSVIRGVRIGFI